MTRPLLTPPASQDLDALDAVALRPLSAAVEQPAPVVTPQSEAVLPSLLEVVSAGLTGGEVLAEAARAGVCKGVLDAAWGLRAQGVLAKVTPLARVEVQNAWVIGGANNNSNNSGSPGRKDTSPWVCASEARSGEVNTQTVQG